MKLQGDHIDIELIPDGHIEIRPRPGGTWGGLQEDVARFRNQMHEHLIADARAHGVVFEPPNGEGESGVE